MKSYRVFHGDEKHSLAPAALGASFHILDSQHEFTRQQALIGDTDYGVLTKQTNVNEVRFLNRAQPFEFCGAGALAIAAQQCHHSEPGNQNTLTHVSSVHSSTITFDILQINRKPAVRLKRENHSLEACDFGPFDDCLLFTSANCFAIPVSLANLQNFNSDTKFRELLVGKQTTTLLYNIDQARKLFYFRYFTSFNNKLEDQATGSVFRYLPHLPKVERDEYTLIQLSQNGALMYCSIHADSLIYWGKVQTINNSEVNRKWISASAATKKSAL